MPFPAPLPGDFSHARDQQDQPNAEQLEQQQQQQQTHPSERRWGVKPDFRAPPGPYGLGVMPEITN